MKNRLILTITICFLLVLASCGAPTHTSDETPSPPTEEEPSQTTPTTPSQTTVELKVHFIDVGQGDSILIDLEDTEILIDGGDKSPGVFTYLNDYVDGALEVMVATHPHADHIGGLIAVLNAFKVEEIWHNGDSSTSKTYDEFMAAIQAEHADTHVGKQGDKINVGELSFTILNPATLNGTTNNNSIVLSLSYGTIGFLFTGDAEREAEAAMLVSVVVPVPDVEILKVGHHGSRTASSQDFLTATSPEVAIYMAGEGNSYGHPHEETIIALSNIGAEIYGTDIHGTIVVTTDGETYALQLERQCEPLSVTPPTPPEELPASTVQLPSVVGEEAQSTELIPVSYSWTYKGEWSWDREIPLSLYEYFQKLPRPPTKNYSVYVTHPLDDPYIDLLVEKIKKAAQQEGYTAYQTVEFAAAFVQSLPYTVDSVTTPYDEYPRYPIETLVDKGGDCEDTSILLASILNSMGYGVVLIMLPDHCAVGVKGSENIYGTYYEYKGSKYYYIETTGEGWGIGELPDEYKNATAAIRPMIPTPILTHEGSIKGSGYIAEVEVIVYNQGTAPAYNVSVLAGFDAGGGMVWNSQKSEPFTIGVDQQATIKLDLRIPLDKHTRLIVQIGIDNVLVEESHTDWFDT